jgi:hypothetical protein
MKRRIYAFAKGFLTLLMGVAAVTACKDDEPEQTPSLYVGEVTTFVLSASGETKVIELQANVAVSLNTQNTAEWCHATIEGNKLTVVADANTALAARTTTVEVSIPGKAETLTFEQGGQPTAKFSVTGATASSTQTNYPIANSYDGVTDGSGHYHSDWNVKDNSYELTYELESNPVLELAIVAYYARPKTISTTTQLPVCSNGTFGAVEVWVATTANPTLTKVKDYTCGDPTNAPADYPIPAYIMLDEPIPGATAVKIVVDGATSKGGFASCAEMEFYGIGASGTSTPYLLVGKSELSFGAAGGSEEISVVTNAESITAADGGWCTATVNGLFVTIAASENTSTSESRTANITITGSNGETKTITVSQARTTPQATLLTVDAEKSRTDSYYDDDGGGNGPVDKTWDGDFTTYWHSNYDDERIDELGPVEPPYALYYYLKDAAELSYIIYYPRNYPTGGNGNFGAIEVWVSTGNDNFTKVMDYNCGQKGAESKIELPNIVANVEAVKIVVLTDLGSCSEMEFYGAKK